MQSLFRHFYGHAALKLCKRPKTYILAGLILTLLSAYFFTHNLDFKTTRSDLSDPDSKLSKLFRTYLSEFRDSEAIITVIESPDKSQNQLCADDVARALSGHPDDFTNVLSRVDLDFLKNRELLFADNLELDSLKNALADLKANLDTGMSGFEIPSILDKLHEEFDLNKLKKSGISEEEWNGFEKLIQFLAKTNHILEHPETEIPAEDLWPSSDSAVDLSSENFSDETAMEPRYYTLADGAIYLVLATPTAQDKSFSPYAAPIATVRQVAKDMRAKYPDLTIGLTGEPVLDQDEVLASQSSGIKSSILSLVLVSAIFILGFREIIRPVIMVIFLQFSIVWSLAYATLAVGHLNILSVGFVSIILGLGIDYGIHILGRIREEERTKHRPPLDAIKIALMQTGVGITEGAITTAVAFFTMIISDFPAIQELGIIAGGSIILAAAGMLFLTPPALFLYAGRSKKKRVDDRQKITDSVLPPHPPHPDKVRLLPLAATVIFIIAVLYLTGLGIKSFDKLSFDYNLLNLQNQNLESVIFEKKLAVNNSSSSMFAVTTAQTPGEAKQKKEKFLRLREVREVVNINEIIPENQNDKIPLIRSLREDAAALTQKILTDPVIHSAEEQTKKLKRLEDRLRLIISHSSEATDKEKGILNDLSGEITNMHDLLTLHPERAHVLDTASRLRAETFQKLFSLIERQNPEAISVSDMPKAIRDRYVNSDGHTVLEIYPNHNIWDRGRLEDFILAVELIDPDAIGTPVLNYEFIRVILNGLKQTAKWATVIIFLIVLIQFRSLVLTGLVFVPLIVGLSWTSYIMTRLDMSLNPANIIILPLVIGIGIDNGIHVMHRFFESRHQSIFKCSTGTSVLISCLTNMAGFASLMISDHRGLASIGFLMAFALAFILMAALTVLPAILYILNAASIWGKHPHGNTIQSRRD